MYEFTDQENGVIAKSAQSSLILGILFIVIGVLHICTLSPVLIIGDIAMGVILLVATGALKAVTTSQGNDVQHMSKAVGLLGTMFIVRVVVMGIIILWELGVTAYLLLMAVL